MKKSMVLLAILSMSLSAEQILHGTNNALPSGKPQQIFGTAGGYNFVDVSLKDLSRIHCINGDVNSIFFSKEKEIEIKMAGGDAFIKILPHKIETGEKEKLEYGSHPREVYLNCDDKTFSLILNPKNIPAQTIELVGGGGYGQNKKAGEFEKANPYDGTLLELVKKAFLGDMPDGYNTVETNEFVGNFNELKLQKKREYVGDRFIVSEYFIEAKKHVNIYEGMFIPYLKNSLAISIIKTNLEPTEFTRMLVVSLNSEAKE